MSHDSTVCVDGMKNLDVNMEIEVVLDGKSHPYDLTVSPPTNGGPVRLKIALWSLPAWLSTPPLSTEDSEAQKAAWARYREARTPDRRKKVQCED